MAFRIADYRNGFLVKATGQLISWIRTPSEFNINRIAKYVESPTPTALYHRLNRDEGIRVDNMNKRLWRPGADLPRGENDASFAPYPIQLQRWAKPWEVDMQTQENFEHFDVKRVLQDQAASVLMTDLTVRAYGKLTTSSNWGGIHVGTAASLNGGSFLTSASAEESSASFNAFFKTIGGAANKILLDTNSKISMNRQRLQLCMNPNTALRLGQTGEISAYLKSSPDAKDWMAGMNQEYGLPEVFRKFEIVVLDDVQVTARQLATHAEETTSRTFIFPDNMMVIMPKNKEIESTYGSKPLSLLQIFWYGKPAPGDDGKYTTSGQMVARARVDTRNAKFEGDCSMQTWEELAVPEAGYLITNLFS